MPPVERGGGAAGIVDLEVARRKAYSYLARRGFGYSAAKEAFEQLQERDREETGD